MQYKHPFKLLDSIVKERADHLTKQLKCFMSAESEEYTGQNPCVNVLEEINCTFIKALNVFLLKCIGAPHNLRKLAHLAADGVDQLRLSAIFSFRFCRSLPVVLRKRFIDSLAEARPGCGTQHTVRCDHPVAHCTWLCTRFDAPGG